MIKQLICRDLSQNGTLRCVSRDWVKAAVRRKMGVGILFYNQIEQDVKRKKLKTLKFPGLPKLMGNSYIVYSKSKPLSSIGDEFLNLLRSMKTQLKNPVDMSESNEE